MSVGPLYECFGFPESALVDKRIYKRMLHEHGRLTAADRRALSEDVERLTWRYALKPETVQIRPFEDEDREYLEVAVIEVSLHTRRRSRRLAEILHASIPYPTLLVLVEDTAYCVSTAEKRFSLAEQGAVVAESLQMSPWIEPPGSDLDKAFEKAISFGVLSHVDFFALYTGLEAAVLARNCADVSGRFELGGMGRQAERMERLGRCREHMREIAALKEEIRKQAHFAAQVDMNVRIKSLEAALRVSKEKL